MAFNPVDIIAAKRDGHALTPEQISRFVSGYSCGNIPDYQMSALLMAIYLRGMQADETTALTQQMLHSGTTLQWSSPAIKVDKHSTGGIGDKVSIVLAPLLACCDVQVPMISGRGLGPTGGTLDKLESIPGFRTDLSAREICQITERVGCVISGATQDIVPADKKLYALRDVTATVASIPLITASIMSKKLAENLDALVLDVKFGSGAFMKSLDNARKLANALVETGRRMKVATSALLTNMNQPLGRMVGNAVEVAESIDTLTDGGPPDLAELVYGLALELLLSTKQVRSPEEGMARLRDHIRSGRALEKFYQMVRAQGGDPEVSRSIAPANVLFASRSGYVSAMDTEQLGRAMIALGGGRRVLHDPIDHRVGLEMLVRLGDEIRQDEPFVRIYAEPDRAEHVKSLIQNAISIRDEPPAKEPLIAERISDNAVEQSKLPEAK